MTDTSSIVPLSELKQHLNITGNEDDVLLTRKLEAARRHVEAWTGALDVFDEVPADIVEAMKQLAAHLYENRELSISGTIIAEVPVGFYALIGPYRNWEF